jgi:hypothetical protein
MTAKPRDYDPACGILAEHFLIDDPVDEVADPIASLAQAIQDAVEAWYYQHRITDADQGPEAEPR